MGKLNFKNGQVEDYTIVLSNRELQKQGQISNVKGVKHNGNLASAQVINFTVYKHQLFPDREEENFPYESIEAYQDYIWENLVDFKVVYVKELNENFEIRVSIDDANDTIKTITGTSLCEVELGQTNLYNFEINSELDISRDDYEVTTFYNDENPNASLLHRVLSKVPHYKIKHVDKSLIKLQRTFSVDGVPIYDFLMGECSEQFSCLFRFDSTDRSVSVYDLMTVCRDCGERGEYTSVCPKCGSKNLQYFGQDTTIYVDKNNLTDSIHLEVDGDSIKNCFKLECGDEVMTAAVRALNPNGSDYIYRINENDRKDMPTELVNKIDSYDELYKSYTEEYHSITEQSYDLVDDILYYQSSMMPTIEESEVTAQTEADKLSKAYYDGNFNLVALTTVTTATNKTTVNSALKNYARIFVKTGYVKLDIEDDATFEYVGVDDNNWNYGTWYGRIKVTNYSDKEDIAYTDYMTITVNDNYHEFVAQKIQKNIKTDDDDGSVFDVLSIDDLEKYKEALTLYSLNRLQSFADAIQGALDILIELDQAGESADLYDILYLPYYEKLKACQNELDIRQAKIDELQHELDLLEERRMEIQADLNFEIYLGDLYPIFCAYRREDKFSNPNYISDGLDNSQLLQRAKEFWELAEKEIFKSSNGVITITATLYNLLAMKEFEPLVKYFELGNWIRIRVDGQLYRLRLIGYEINFDSLQTINVTFSTVTKIKDLNVETEIESVIQSTKSMAKSYSSVQKQAEKGREANDNVNSILQDGLNAGQSQITNNVNEEVTYGKHGILCRSYDDILGDFVDKQLKLTHNTIAFTDDNWKSVKTVIGENSYLSYNPTENKWEQLVGYGLTSQYVMSGVIYGENEIIGGMIRSKNYSDGKTLDKDGNILAKAGSYIDLDTGEFSFGGDSLYYRDDKFVINETVLGQALEVADIKAENLRIDAGNVEGDFVSKNFIGGQIYSLDYEDNKVNPTTHINLNSGEFSFAKGHFIYSEDDGLVSNQLTINSLFGEDSHIEIKFVMDASGENYDGFSLKYALEEGVWEQLLGIDLINSRSGQHGISIGNVCGDLNVYGNITPFYDGGGDLEHFDLGSSTNRWNNIYAVTGTIQTSDKNAKKEISTLSDEYEELFMSLSPVSYKFNNGERTHIGFIAQDVELSMKGINLSNEDFAALCIDNINGENQYGLRYDEFIALNTHMIQKLFKRMNELENKIVQ